MILRNGRHLLSLVDDLLDVARLEAGKFEIRPVECSLPEILADVYLVMTGGQTSLSLSGKSDAGQNQDTRIRRLKAYRPSLKVIKASQDELKKHAECLEVLDKASDGNAVWKKILTDA